MDSLGERLHGKITLTSTVSYQRGPSFILPRATGESHKRGSSQIYRRQYSSWSCSRRLRVALFALLLSCFKDSTSIPERRCSRRRWLPCTQPLWFLADAAFDLASNQTRRRSLAILL